jgi:hypothetical protein
MQYIYCTVYEYTVQQYREGRKKLKMKKNASDRFLFYFN